MFANTLAFIIFWAGFAFILAFWTYVVYNWEYNMTHNRSETIFLAIICSFYMFLGILSCIFIMPDKINKANEYEAYQKEVVLPIENRYNNTELPDGHYYLGVEICGVQQEGDTYVYDFATVDYEVNDNIYQYETEQELTDAVPYMLAMDSLGTEDLTDDQIVVVWACIE